MDFLSALFIGALLVPLPKFSISLVEKEDTARGVQIGRGATPFTLIPCVNCSTLIFNILFQYRKYLYEYRKYRKIQY